MSTMINVARYHLSDRLRFVLLPCGVTAFAFLVTLVILAMVPPSSDQVYTGGLGTAPVYLGIAVAISVTIGLPFALTLGLSRRRYYLGTIVLVLGLAAVYSLGLAVLQALERSTDGWGVSMNFFRIPWILNGPWYLTWLTAFVLLTLTMLYGIWFGLVYRRWGFTGVLAFVAAQIIVLLAAALAVTRAEAWLAVGDFFTTLTVLGLTGVLADLAAALGLGGYSTIRRVTV